jgi:ubiquinone/menaquinone biosynthesis C-methylase UbiE
VYTKKFDFIHMRAMMSCFKDPRSIIAKAYAALEPGGYLEMLDAVFPLQCHDDTLEGTALDTWAKACVQAAANMGRPWTNVPYYRQWMEELGFEDVKEKKFEVATSTWPKGVKQKELALWWQADLLQVLGATIRVLTKGLGYDPAEVELLLVDVRKDVNNRNVHAYMPM